MFSKRKPITRHPKSKWFETKQNVNKRHTFLMTRLQAWNVTLQRCILTRKKP